MSEEIPESTIPNTGQEQDQSTEQTSTILVCLVCNNSFNFSDGHACNDDNLVVSAIN